MSVVAALTLTLKTSVSHTAGTWHKTSTVSSSADFDTTKEYDLRSSGWKASTPGWELYSVNPALSYIPICSLDKLGTYCPWEDVHGLIAASVIHKLVITLHFISFSASPPIVCWKSQSYSSRIRKGKRDHLLHLHYHSDSALLHIALNAVHKVYLSVLIWHHGGCMAGSDSCERLTVDSSSFPSCFRVACRRGFSSVLSRPPRSASLPPLLLQRGTLNHAARSIGNSWWTLSCEQENLMGPVMDLFHYCAGQNIRAH